MVQTIPRYQTPIFIIIGIMADKTCQTVGVHKIPSPSGIGGVSGNVALPPPSVEPFKVSVIVNGAPLR